MNIEIEAPVVEDTITITLTREEREVMRDALSQYENLCYYMTPHCSRPPSPLLTQLKEAL